MYHERAASIDALATKSPPKKMDSDGQLNFKKSHSTEFSRETETELRVAQA